MGVAGFNTRIRKGGSTTAMSDEPMTAVGTSNLTFQIVDSSKQVWDRDVALTFETDTGGTLSPKSVDYLFGKVVFSSPKTSGVNVSGNYLPMGTLATARRYTLNQSLSLQNADTYSTAQTSGGYRFREGTLLDASVTIGRFHTNVGGFWSSLQTRESFLIEITPGGGAQVFRGWFKLESDNLSGDVEALEEDELSFQLDEGKGAGTNHNVAFSWN